MTTLRTATRIIAGAVLSLAGALTAFVGVVDISAGFLAAGGALLFVGVALLRNRISKRFEKMELTYGPVTNSTNPATGMPMVGGQPHGFDIGGNIYGTRSNLDPP